MPKIRKTVVLDIPGANTLGNADFKVQLASDASGEYVPVVALDSATINADLSLGPVELTYNVTPPTLSNGQTVSIQGDSSGRLLTSTTGTVAVGSPLPAGSNTIGKVDQGVAGSSAWKVDPSGVTSPVSAASLPLPTNAAQEVGGNLDVLAGAVSAGKIQATVATMLPAGSNVIGGVTQSGTWTVTANAGTNLNTSALALESGGNLATLAGTVSASKVQTTVATALPAGTNTIGGIYSAPTSSSSFAITPGSSAALEATHVLKASAGNLYALYVTTTTVAGFLMTFNATSAPADGSVTPIECVAVPAGSTASISNDGSPPDAYSTGIVAVFSTTGPFTKTASATAFFKWRVQ